MLLQKIVEIVTPDSTGQFKGDKIFIGYFGNQFVKRIVGNSEITAVLVMEKDLSFDKLRRSVTVTADLKELLVALVRTQKIRKDFE